MLPSYLLTLSLLLVSHALPISDDGQSSRWAPTPTPSSTSSSPSNQSCTELYTVVSEDICDTIADRFNIPMGLLLALNPAIKPDCSNLVPGEVLCIFTDDTSSDVVATVSESLAAVTSSSPSTNITSPSSTLDASSTTTLSATSTSSSISSSLSDISTPSPADSDSTALLLSGISTGNARTFRIPDDAESRVSSSQVSDGTVSTDASTTTLVSSSSSSESTTSSSSSNVQSTSDAAVVSSSPSSSAVVASPTVSHVESPSSAGSAYTVVVQAFTE